MKSTIHMMIAILIIVVVPIYYPSITKAINDTSLQTYDNDITGDGFHEQIEMKGSLLSNTSTFYQDIWVEIQSVFEKKWSISLQNGYDPQIFLIDLNHDAVSDIFYQVKKDSENDKYHYQIYTLKLGKTKKIPLPERVYAKGKFTDGFQVQIQLDPHQKSETFQLNENRDMYIKQNIYDENGILRKETPIQIEPISELTPVIINNSKGYGLTSFQKIKGINKKDNIGTLKTLWHFRDHKWIILKSEVIA